MSFHRSLLVALATLVTAGVATAAHAGCCDWGGPAPVAYSQWGCGGCGTAYAPIIYATPVAPAPISVGCGGCGAPTAAIAFAPPVAPAPTYLNWAGGCGTCGVPAQAYYAGCGTCGWPANYGYAGCGGCGIQAVYTAPAPLYVVNQGPNFTGPGVMVPYHTWAPPAEYAPPPAYPPYLYRHRYYPAPYYRHVYYRPRVYGPRYYGPHFVPHWGPVGHWRG